MRHHIPVRIRFQHLLAWAHPLQIDAVLPELSTQITPGVYQEGDGFWACEQEKSVGYTRKKCGPWGCERGQSMGRTRRTVSPGAVSAVSIHS